MTHRAGLWLVSFPQAGAVSLQGHDETRALICRDDTRKTTARPAKWKGLAFASDHPDAMPQAIKLIDAKGRSCIAPFPDSSGVLCAINASNSTSVTAGCRLHSPIKMTIDRIKALIDELRTQKLNFVPSGNRKAVPGGLPLPPSSTLHEGVTDRGSAGESGPLDIPEQRPSIWDRSVWLF
jgi:hypothetical protein